MKTVYGDLLADVSGDLTSLCLIVTITGKDGMPYHFTDHEREITVDGELYLTKSFEASATQLSLNAPAGDVDIVLFLDDNGISRLAVESGLYDSASIELQAVSYLDTTMRVMLLKGRVRSIGLNNPMAARFTCVGNSGLLNAPICESYSLECRAQFGDARCKVDLAQHSLNFTINQVISPQSFNAVQAQGKPVNHYAHGRVEWISGPNRGTITEVIQSTGNGNVVLMFRTPFPMAEGHTGKLVRGCQKTLNACRAYNNVINYRGEPYVPTGV